MLASVADLPQIYAVAKEQGAEVVAIRALDDKGAPVGTPDLIVRDENIIGAQSFAWVADHQDSRQAWIQVQVVALRPPFDKQVSDFIEPDAVAAYVETGKPVGKLNKPLPGVGLKTPTGTSTMNEVTHTRVATFKEK